MLRLRHNLPNLQIQNDPSTPQNVSTSNSNFFLTTADTFARTSRNRPKQTLSQHSTILKNKSVFVPFDVDDATTYRLGSPNTPLPYPREKAFAYPNRAKVN